MTKKLRQGATGALFDEYERAISHLQKVIETIPDHAIVPVLRHRRQLEKIKLLTGSDTGENSSRV